MEAKATKPLWIFLTAGLVLGQALVGGAFAQSGRPKVLVLPPASSIDKKVISQFQWELAKDLDKSGKFDIVNQEQYEEYLHGMRIDRDAQVPDSLIPAMMDSLKATIYTTGNLNQPGGVGTSIQSKIDYIYLNKQADSKNYTIEGKEVSVENEKMIDDLARQTADVVITASDRISAMTIAYSYFRSAIYDKAIENYDKLLSVDPKNINARYMIATCCLKMDSTEKAIQLYKDILQNLDPNHVSTLENLANIFYTKGEYVQSLDYFERLVKLEPKNFGYVQYAAYCLNKLDRQVESLAMFDKLVEIKDESPEIRQAMGSAAYKLALNPPAGTDTTKVLGFWEGAIKNFGRAVDIYQTSGQMDDSQKKNASDCIYYQGLSQYKLGRFPAAVATFKKLTQLSPDYPGIYGLLAQICDQNLKQYDDALNYYKEALKTTTEDKIWIYYYSIGQIYRMQKQDARNAVEAYTSALKSAPADKRQALYLLRGIEYYDLAQEMDYSGPGHEDADIDKLIETGQMTSDKADKAIALYDQAAADLSKVTEQKWVKSAQDHLKNIDALKVRATQIKKQVAYYEKTK